MGGLGNGRRGGRSPPLLIGALIACVLVLGFNYWVSSSRNLELQTRLFEMEGAVRRAGLDRGTLEEKKKELEEKLRMQTDQIPRMEDRHKIQLDTVLANWKQETTSLVLNISASARTIQNFKDQLANLEQIQKELQDCQTSRINLSTAMTECKAQLDDLKEECAAPPTALLEKSAPDLPTSQENSGPSLSRTDQAEKPGLDDTKRPPVSVSKTTQTDADPDTPKAKPSTLETNELPKTGDGEAPPSLTGRAISKPERSIVLLTTATGKSAIPKQEHPASAAKQGGELEVMETHTVKLQVTGNRLIWLEKGDKPVDEPGEESENKPEDQQNAADSEIVKPAQVKDNADQTVGRASLDLKKEVADYNGDDDNEGESEAEKQAELAKH